jgi:hypothetical protein
MLGAASARVGRAQRRGRVVARRYPLVVVAVAALLPMVSGVAVAGPLTASTPVQVVPPTARTRFRATGGDPKDAVTSTCARGDELVITRISRMARSIRHLTEIAALLHEESVDLVVIKQGIDTTTPAGRFVFQVIGAMDEMLADLISESTLEGLAAARSRGRTGVRKPKLTARQDSGLGLPPIVRSYDSQAVGRVKR